MKENSLLMFISFLLCLHWICSVRPHSSHILGLFFFYLRPGPTMPPCLIPLPLLSIVDLFIIYLIPYQSSSFVILLEFLLFMKRSLPFQCQPSIRHYNRIKRSWLKSAGMHNAHSHCSHHKRRLSEFLRI